MGIQIKKRRKHLLIEGNLDYIKSRHPKKIGGLGKTYPFFHKSLSKNHLLLVVEDVEPHSCDLLLRPNEAVVTDRWQEN